MKKLFATIILTLFALGSLFHGTHIQYDQGSDLPVSQSLLTQYPKVSDVVVFPMTNIPF
jgi:hypothetical protein